MPIDFSLCLLKVFPGYFICQICESYHDSLEELNAHYEKDHPPNKYSSRKKRETKRERKFNCDHCDASYTEKVTLRKHLKKVHDVTLQVRFQRKKGTGSIQCDLCGARLSGRTSVVYHMKHVHGATRNH